MKIALAATKAGRNVMLEKPPGSTLAECQILQSVAKEAGVSIYATWHSRRAGGVALAKAWLSGKRLRRVSVTWKEDFRRWHPGQQWNWVPGGLGVFDPGINALSILTEILSGPIHVASAALSFPSNCQTPIAASISFAGPDGAEIAAEFDFRQQGEQIWTIAVETDRGNLTLREGGALLVIDGMTPSRVDPNHPLDGEHPRLYADMARLVQAGASEMDLSPMVLVADAFLLGRRLTVEPFIE